MWQKKSFPFHIWNCVSQILRINRKKYSTPEFTPELKIHKRIRYKMKRNEIQFTCWTSFCSLYLCHYGSSFQGICFCAYKSKADLFMIFPEGFVDVYCDAWIWWHFCEWIVTLRKQQKNVKVIALQNHSWDSILINFVYRSLGK